MVDFPNKPEPYLSGLGFSTPVTSTSETQVPMKAEAPKPIWQKDEAKAPDGKGTVVEKQGEAAAKAAPKNLVKPTPHKVNKGFYPATNDANAKITGKNGILANEGQKIKESNDPAGTVADAVLSTKSDSAGTAMEKNQVRQMIIKANPSVFTPDGKLKKDADLGKLDIPTRDYLKKSVDKSDPKRSVIPKGFYPAFKDGSGDINGLTESQIRQNEGKAGKNTAGAIQIMDALLKTKGATFMASGERKAALLNDLVRKNPSVFNADGTLKKDADLTKLDVPSMDYMSKSYAKLPYKSSLPVTFGNNGYYAVGTGKGAKFYLANGHEVPAETFKKHCPSIYKTITAAT